MSKTQAASRLFTFAQRGRCGGVNGLWPLAAGLPLEPLPTARRDLSRYKRRFQVMVKPVGPACNLGCDYCFYLHKAELMPSGSTGPMSDELLERFIRDFIDSNDNEEIVFSWQGGEPTLAGLPFFEKALKIQTEARPSGRRLVNTLQTNGTLITDEWAAFLKRHDFLVGLSVDGPEDLHDLHRRDAAGRPTFRRVMEGWRHLDRHGVPFNVLAAINRDNALKPLELYRFFTGELGATYLQFNPCVEPAAFENVAPHFWARKDQPLPGSPRLNPGGPNSLLAPWSLRAEDWGAFLIAVFEEWREKDLGRVLVNWFETAVAQLIGQPAQLCTSGEICGKAVALERDGRVYSCDHYVYPEYELGRLGEHSLAEMVFSRRQMSFGLAKRDSLPGQCLGCPHGLLCWGQCPRHRFMRSPNGEYGLNYLCAGWQTFFSHCGPDLKAIASALKTSPVPA